eukprot:10302-Heterococcus_DN1.PRE.2
MMTTAARRCLALSVHVKQRDMRYRLSFLKENIEVKLVLDGAGTTMTSVLVLKSGEALITYYLDKQKAIGEAAAIAKQLKALIPLIVAEVRAAVRAELEKITYEKYLNSAENISTFWTEYVASPELNA